MTTSSNTTWELASTALVNSAYRKLGYLAEGQTLSTEALANGVEALNSIVALLVTKGMPLWKRTTALVAPSATNQVYTISNAVKVAQVVLKDSTGAQYPLVEKSLYDFNRLPVNAAAAAPVHYMVQPTLSDSVVSIWPTTSDAGTISTKTIAVVYQKKFDGFVSASDTLDFPSYWDLPVMLKLAATLAPEAGIPIQDRTYLKAEADEAIKMASDYGDEDGSYFIQPARR